MSPTPSGRISTILCGVVLASAPLGAQARTTVLADLPITEVPANSGNTLAIFWSGDGGWASLVSSISKELAANGVAVVGVNARAWMERGRRTPNDLARDTERLLRTYLAQWSRTRVVLLGYSRGAGFMPFIVNRLPPDLRERVTLVGLLGAEHSASFEFHLQRSDQFTLPLARQTGERELSIRQPLVQESVDALLPVVAEELRRLRHDARASDEKVECRARLLERCDIQIDAHDADRRTAIIAHNDAD